MSITKSQTEKIGSILMVTDSLFPLIKENIVGQTQNEKIYGKTLKKVLKMI